MILPRQRRLPACREDGQSVVLLVGVLCALLVGGLILGAVARGIGIRSEAQRAADLAALAGARALLDAYPRLFEPATTPDGRPNPAHLEKPAYLALGRTAALRLVARNGAGDAAVTFADDASFAPVRIVVEVRRRVDVGHRGERRSTRVAAVAEAELLPAGQDLGPGAAAGEYAGRFASRQGKLMRPDVAAALDRMTAAARADGHQLLVSSAYRSDAEQAVLFAARPDPRWVAPPGTSLHRLGTELDLGPSSAYGWLAANAGRFHFVMRYAWEPWHYGYTLNARSSASAGGDSDANDASVAHADDPDGGTAAGADGGASASAAGKGSVPGFVPARYIRPITTAAQRWNVSATLLAAQLYAESGFNPFAVSPAGAQGIAQFMPGTAAGYGLHDPFDADSAIDAQARLMRDLLRRFASVPLALAAYNAGPVPVAACMCVPPYPETRGYVARILGLMAGAGDAGGGGLAVRLVR